MTTPVNGFAVTTSHPQVHVVRAAGVLDMSASGTVAASARCPSGARRIRAAAPPGTS